jgi:hypothetical protein
MTRHMLAALPDQLEMVGAALSETLLHRYGTLASRGVIPPRVTVFFKGRKGSAEQTLDEFCTLTLYNDCLTLVTFACLTARAELNWAQLEGLRLLLSRIASFYALVLPGFEAFRSLPRERLGLFLNEYAARPEVFGLRCPETRFLGLALCAHAATSAGGPLLDRYLADVLRPLWEFSHRRVGSASEAAVGFWADLEARARTHQNQAAPARP